MKHLTLALLGVLLILSCNTAPDLNLIEKHQIGLLNDSTQVKDLKAIFSSDSLVTYIDGDEFTGTNNDIDIYSKEGEMLLSLSPKQALDSTSTIKTVQIVHERFKTASGINTLSTFKDIRDNHKISSIQNTIRNVIVSVDEINAFFTIDKQELPAEMRFDMDIKIEALQIPNEAKIKGFFIQWL